ncbi:MAG: NIPSNAP family protein [Rhizobiaceae bacterium]|nr:NIPSNAP family protein [Rhizobiaceae bacterium]MCV0404958.1 NIPSNAP family protein [Rhizobiaceae bacterium]
MLYEMRQYLIDRGRLDDNHARMRDHTPPLLEKHGVEVAGRWAALAGPRTPMFCYIMEWRDFAEREKAWGAFYADPEWPQVRAATNAGSEMVQENHLFYMRPNPAFRQEEGDSRRRLGGVHQITVQKIAIGQNPAVADFLGSTYIPRLEAAGAHVIGICDLVSGPGLPAIVSIVAWPDAATWLAGGRAFESDGAMRAAYQKQRDTLGATLLGSAETIVADPAPYALPYASLRTSPR